MIDSVNRITLNLQESNTMVSIKAKRGDTGRKLLIHLSDGGLPYHISEDCYATFTASKPDGNKINNPCTIKNNVIEYEFTEQTCSAVGMMEAEIRLYGGNSKMITSACFLICVCDTVFHDGDEDGSEGEMATLDALILETNELICSVQTKLDNGEFVGETGADGKSAYEYAQDGGYTGTEEEFAEMMASGGQSDSGEGADLSGYIQKSELEEAVIDALAQAKESGEFDGADGQDGQDGFSPAAEVIQEEDGATINITDKTGTTTATVKNGKDGAAGQDGYTPQKGVDYFDGESGVYVLGDGETIDDAPEDAEVVIDPNGEPDGSGFDIQGAQVGQIVQIAAVDENGVPTEWIPVDMPSGGDDSQWELITEITIEEDDITEVYVTEKDDGSAFEYTDICVKMVSIAAASFWKRVLRNPGSNTSDILFESYCNAAAGKDTSIIAIYHPGLGYVGEYGGLDGGQINRVMVMDYVPITSLKLYNQGGWDTGSTITVYGRKREV